jgi:streptogramin lyase
VPGIYVSDWRQHSIFRLTALTDGQPGRLGGYGSGVQEFTTPCGMAFDSSGRLYVADRGNHRVVRVDDINGSGWTSSGTLGAGDGQFNSPTDVFLDSGDHLYIADTGNHRIVGMDDLNGNGWQSFGLPGRPTAADPAAVGRFAEPNAVCVDGQGTITISDRGNGRIVQINDLDGTDWVAFGPAPPSDDAHPRGPTGVRPASGDTVLVADFGGGRLLRLEEPGTAGQETIRPYTGDEPGLLGPTSAVAVASVDGGGLPVESLLVVDGPSRRLMTLTRDQGQWALAEQQLDVGGDTSRLYGLAIEPV